MPRASWSIVSTGEGESPHFYIGHMDRQKVEAVLKDELEAFPELFLIDLSITSEKDIYIYLDGDQGVFLEVSSAGGIEPL